MQAPAFWWRAPEAPGLRARLLSPLAWIWAATARWRLLRANPVQLGVPVICVGNIAIGGTGKTPTVIALVERLKRLGVCAHVVSRGHGGRLQGPVRVDPRRHSAADVGDEPLLLAAFAPVWIGRERSGAARAAVADGAQCVVLDDGLQNTSLAPDLSIVVVDAAVGFGNGRVIPAGPLREPVPDGLARADVVLAIGPPVERAGLLARWPALSALPVLGGALLPLPTGMEWRGLRAVAFAGIGRPGKFFASLADLGVEIVSAHALPDHAAFSPKLLARLEAEAVREHAQLVTTEKDAVRLPEAMRRQVLVLPVRLEIDDWTYIEVELTVLGLVPREKGAAP